ncbi:MAG: sugar MFS transporter [Cytophagales bacterium]|jgi:FHS family L-fucose permease-like MFS transporter|nr:sugar MFS transporter [Cytophagales bacterium]MCA6387149.1 sugar MFS transporter [Cytophagales bacterium]MCA6390394.1 sugar MFS transporter [Cytophagales bacterium]MCA6395593.1 sugar MFS transporter [Cytophagales bacterium]MCA6399698.1 sugar MFS transporter [Cytophagales bacterium]
MSSNKNYVLSISIIGLLFFIFGFVTWLNSVLIPFLKQACELTNFQAYFVTLAFYISYFVMAIPSSYILKKTGFTKGMSLGLAVMGIGSLVFIPAAQMRSYPLFLIGLFTQGTGLTLLQTASNPYVTILGPIESAAKRISIMGICNKVAGMIGIYILVELLFSDTKAITERIQSLSGSDLAAELDALASRVIAPYTCMAIVLFGLAAMLLKAPLPEINPEDNDSATGVTSKKRESIFDFPHLILGVICIFMYVGVEVIAIDTIGLYGQYQGFDLNTSSKFGIYSLITLVACYILGIVVMPKYISQRNALIVSAVLGIVFTFSTLISSGGNSIVFVILLSFANTLMWPCIWPLALDNLGRFTKTGSALLIMGIAGGAILPLAYGAISDVTNRQTAYIIMIPLYIYIFYYAIKGYKVGKSA